MISSARSGSHDLADRPDPAEINRGGLRGAIQKGLGQDRAADPLACGRLDQGRHDGDAMIAEGLGIERNVGSGVDILEKAPQALHEVRELLAEQHAPEDDRDVGIAARRAERLLERLVAKRRAEKQDDLALLWHEQGPALRQLAMRDLVRLAGQIPQQWVAAALLAQNVGGFADRRQVIRRWCGLGPWRAR